MKFKVHPTENLLFVIKLLATILVMLGFLSFLSSIFALRNTSMMSTFVVFIVYAVFIWLFVIFQKVYLIAYLKGNGIEITENQFNDVYIAYLQMANDLGIKKVSKLFLVQQGGLLNAFAVRFSGKNYVAIYSDIFSLIHSDIDAVKFVLAHELGHVKRKHMSKRFWTFPSSIIPFLTAAYSRACEYTCDNFGNAISPNGSLNGLLVLAAGKELYKQINIENYIETQKKNNTFSVKFIGLFISHPYLPKRIHNLKEMID